MKYVFLVEDDLKSTAQLAESILMIDPTIKIKVFKDLQRLKNWCSKFSLPEDFEKAGLDFSELEKTIRTDIKFSDARQKGISRGFKRLAAELSEQMIGIILKAEFFNKDNEITSYIKELKDFLIKNNLYNNSDPTAFCITSFDNPNFNINNLKDPDIRNIFFKPFDRPILLQHMEFALLGYQPLKISTVHTQQTDFQLEILKSIEIMSISDFGFVTKSESEIAIGMVNRYYSDIFKTSTLKSVNAKCLGIRHDPDSTNNFFVYFSYFGMLNEQINNLRKILKDRSKSTRTREFMEYNSSHKYNGLSLAIIEDATSGVTCTINDSVERVFKNAKVAVYKSLSEFEQTTSENKIPVDGIIFCNSFFTSNEEGATQALLEKVNSCNNSLGNKREKIPIFIITSKPFSRDKEKIYGKIIDDIFYLPIDRAYMLKKIALFFNKPDMTLGSTIDLTALPLKEKLKASNPVKIKEISEAHMLMEYYRALKNGEFREFLLRTANENESQELMACCNSSSEIEEEGVKKFAHQFVYFGVRDTFLKFIRIWIRDIYIDSKKGSGS